MKTTTFIIVLILLVGKFVHHIRKDPDRISDNIECSEQEIKRKTDKEFDQKCTRFDGKLLYVDIDK